MADVGVLSAVEADGVRFAEGQAGRPFLTSAEHATQLVEACWSLRVSSVLLYPDNLTSGFFDLGSRQAGAILQKLRVYRVRLAVVCVPGAVRFSSHFGEMLAEERRGNHFGVFETRDAALEWLADSKSRT
jgi:hypothetical protein